MGQEERDDLVSDLIARVRGAALARHGGQRGWELVRLAAILRKSKHYDQALGVLDEIEERFENPDVVRAAFTCAVALHCDCGEPELAILVGEEQRARTSDGELLHALVRAYWERWKQTGSEEARAAWAACGAELKSFERSAAVA